MRRVGRFYGMENSKAKVGWGSEREEGETLSTSLSLPSLEVPHTNPNPENLCSTSIQYGFLTLE